MNEKVKTIKQITEITSKLKNKKIGYIQGCFDILHIGHIELIKTAAKHVDLLVAGIETDEYITKHKGKGRPLFKLKDRLEVLSHLSHIDYIFVFENHNLEGEEMNNYYRRIPAKLNVTHLFSSSAFDQFFELRRKDAAINNMKLIDIQLKKRSSSTTIYKKFLKWVE